MERPETGYCECPKKPGGVLEVDGLGTMIHTVCGKKIGPMPKERKPVYCGHPASQSRIRANERTICDFCGAEWMNWEEEPKVEIGYVEGE